MNDDAIATPDDRGHDLGGVGTREPRHLHQVGSPVGGPLPAVAGRIERRGGALVSDQVLCKSDWCALRNRVVFACLSNGAGVHPIGWNGWRKFWTSRQQKRTWRTTP